MLRNIAAWAIAFAVSMVLSLIPGINVPQGPAFLVLYLIVCLGVLIFTLVTSLFASSVNGSMQGAGVLALWNAGVILLITLAALAVSGLAAWFFKLDFFVAYQLITLGQCLMWTIKLPGAPATGSRQNEDPGMRVHVGAGQSSVTDADGSASRGAGADAGVDAGTTVSAGADAGATGGAGTSAEMPSESSSRPARSRHYASSGKYAPK